MLGIRRHSASGRVVRFGFGGELAHVAQVDGERPGILNSGAVVIYRVALGVPGDCGEGEDLSGLAEDGSVSRIGHGEEGGSEDSGLGPVQPEGASPSVV